MIGNLDLKWAFSMCEGVKKNKQNFENNPFNKLKKEEKKAKTEEQKADEWFDTIDDATKLYWKNAKSRDYGHNGGKKKNRRTSTRKTSRKR